MNQLKAAALVLLAAGLGAPAQASPLPRYGLFLFSSLCGDPEGGDIGGAELVIVRLRNRNEIIFDYGSGPLFGTEVNQLSIQGDKLTAKLTSDEGGTASLTATLSAERVDGRFTFNGAAPDAPASQNQLQRPLMRVTDFGRPLPNCR